MRYDKEFLIESCQTNITQCIHVNCIYSYYVSLHWVALVGFLDLPTREWLSICGREWSELSFFQIMLDH